MKNKFVLAVAATTMALLTACSSGIKKADIAATANPTEEVARLERDLQTASEKHVDLLAKEDFDKSRKHLKEAREELKDNKSQKKVLEEVAYAQAFLNKATARADGKRGAVADLLTARDSAMQAGVAQNASINEKLKKVDEDVQDDTKDFTKGLSVDKHAEFQRKYLNLELEGIKHKYLGNAQAQINGAENDKASKLAPHSLKTAQLAFRNADNLITANRADSGSFQPAVDKTNESAQTLIDVMNIVKSNKGKVNEMTALRLVQQNKQIAGLKNNLGETQEQVASLNSTLRKEQAELSAAEKQVQMQKAMEAARKQFGKDEAEVYQQGDKLVIRLKKMNFASGGAALPAESLELLAKVKDVAMELNPSSIVVEGHTDSTGSSSKNKSLSEERADAVAKYFQSNVEGQLDVRAIGYGFEKPIATNKTKEGRLQNRRVDVIVTPATASAATPADPATSRQ